MGMRKERGRTT